MNERAIGYLIVAGVLALPISVYIISKGRKAASFSIRFGFILLSVLLVVFAYVGTFAYAVPVLEDFRNPGVPFTIALIGNILIWTLCLGAWFFAFRFGALGFGKNKSLP